MKASGRFDAGSAMQSVHQDPGDSEGSLGPVTRAQSSGGCSVSLHPDQPSAHRMHGPGGRLRPDSLYWGHTELVPLIWGDPSA